MSNHNFPRIPVRLLAHNQDLVKAQAGQSPTATDYSQDVTVAQVRPGVQPSYRTPAARVNGNAFFRRYMDGSLDLEYACHLIIDALHHVKDCGGVDSLNTAEKTALSVLFPQSFMEVDATMVAQVAQVQFRLSPAEVEMLRVKVASKLAAELNWNAGLGGGSVPGREVTRT